MTDWRDTRIELLEEFRGGRKSISRSISKAFEGVMTSFNMAVIRWSGFERNPDPLIEWLRSDRPITESDREFLAEAIEATKLAPRRVTRGRPRNRSLHGATVAARHLYKRWRRLNAERGINDYGHRSEMMDEAIRMAIEVESWEGVKPEAVRELMERPTYRRN
ncbi:hypothetical protein [Aurantimonas marina]|uniref:hypothetical protein n=1 Tax=Aurantimonas marina TaxID=2780508 RepID=UPI0019D23A9D|nr:hypothetical protein [Aurantimonas marina]